MNITKAIQSAFECHRTGNFEQAEYLYKKILKKQPDNPDILHMLGTLFCQLANYDLAIKYIRRALQLKPADSASAHYNLGLALQGNGQLDEAVIHYQKTIELNPAYAKAYCNLGYVFKEKGQLDEAITHCQKALQLNPSFAEAYCNLGYALLEKGQLDEAITHCQKALQLNPSFAQAYYNLGCALKEKGQPNEAFTHFQKTLEIDPSFANASADMSLILLLWGNFKEGWEKYEWRFKVKGARRRTLPVPRWDGSPLTGKKLLIYAEQGIGEEIMFASCLPEVSAQAGLCVIECDKRLVPLFARSFPKATVIPHFHSLEDLPARIPITDVKIAIGSLPFFLRSDMQSFPEYNAYLIPDSLKVDNWRNRFTTLGRGRRVGISWRGGSKASEKRLRSTVLEQWTALFSVPGVHFINLQYGDCSEEIREAKEKLGATIHHWEDADPLKDLDGFAAQVAALDLVISVDNSTAHMAGALGVPVWTLLPFTCEWRWLLTRENSPWYPTMRLFRQPSPGDWNSVIIRVSKELGIYIERLSAENSQQNITPQPPLLQRGT